MSQQDEQVTPRITGIVISNSEERAASVGGIAAQPQAPGGGGSVTPPSNTVTDGYKGGEDKGYRLLRAGIDSLYLSFHGDIFQGVDSELGQLKYLAQSRYATDKAQAQKQIGSHIFEVWDRGQGAFAYILQDGAYRISVKSGESGRLPLAWVKVSGSRRNASPRSYGIVKRYFSHAR